jgi:hypothetical protein
MIAVINAVTAYYSIENGHCPAVLGMVELKMVFYTLI